MSAITPQRIAITPDRHIGEFIAHVTISERMEDSWDIARHPLQTGANVSDHSVTNAPTLELEVVWGETEDAPVTEVYEKLRALADSRIPMQVVTGRRVYAEMCIERMSTVLDAANESILRMSLALVQITRSEVTVTAMPKRAPVKYKSPTGGGQRSATRVTDENPGNVDNLAKSASAETKEQRVTRLEAEIAQNRSKRMAMGR